MAMNYEVLVDENLVRTFGLELMPRSDVLDWLTANVGKKGYYSTKTGWHGKWICGGRFKPRKHISFMEANDALMFKLTWGGQ